jgi:hypothetical protein
MALLSKIDLRTRQLCLIWASSIALLGPFVLTDGWVDPRLVSRLSWLSWGMAAILFARLLADRKCHKGVQALNKKAEVYQASLRHRMTLLDENWGLFGKMSGNRSNMMVVVTLLVETMISQWVFGADGGSTGLLGATLFVAMLVMMIDIALKHAAANST